MHRHQFIANDGQGVRHFDLSELHALKASLSDTFLDRQCDASPNSSMLCGFDDDLAVQTTQASNRIRGLLAHIHPALERVLGPRLD